MDQVEISSLDLRYESCRMKNIGAEKMLCISIMENGIRDPLQGVDKDDVRILLNGFKRYRCAQKLGIGIVPYHSTGNDEALGIIDLLRASNARSLSILEQAKLIDELKTVHRMSAGEISRLLERSKAWVSVRVGMITEMSPCVLEKVFKGEFPAYSYLYTIRQFMRINTPRKDIDEFVCAVSGHRLSVRDIEVLASGYFRGTDEFRQQIQEGNLAWGLSRLREPLSDSKGCAEYERVMLRDLEMMQKYMQRVMYRTKDKRFQSNSFFVQANLMSGGILRQLGTFTESLRLFYDRSGQTQVNLSASS